MDPDPTGISYHFLYALLNIFTIEVLVIFLIFIALLLASAIISGSEIAYFSLKPDDTSKLENEKSNVGKTILKLLSSPAKLLATILISNNFVNIAIVILSTYLLSLVIPNQFYQSTADWTHQNLPFLGMSKETIISTLDILIATVFVTFLLVLFGEVAPKIYAKQNNVTFAKFTARPLRILSAIFRPLSNILVNWTDRIEKRFGNNLNSYIKRDIDQAIELTANQNPDVEDEANILKGIMNFSELNVKQIMCPRTDVVAFDHKGNFKDLISVIKESSFSRIPIYEDDFDKVLGIFYAKDLIGLYDESEKYDWLSLMRTDLLFVPETKKVNELLKEFQSKRVHMAIVVDEYGGSLGIVTLEDIMEEIVGDIKDEFDEPEQASYVKLSKNNYIFEAKTTLTDFARICELNGDKIKEFSNDADTIAGMILEHLGHIPPVDKELNIHGLKMKVISANKKRVEKVSMNIEKWKEEI